jgi:hypothetical protein
MVFMETESHMQANSSDLEEIKDHIPWISELALKKFDYADKSFDTINTRAGIVIGWAGLLTSVFLPGLGGLSQQVKVLVVAIWAFPFAMMLYFGYRAFSVARIKPLPITDDTLEEATALPNTDSRARMVRMVLQAAEANEDAGRKKAKDLMIAIRCFAVQMLILISSLILSSVWPE